MDLNEILYNYEKDLRAALNENDSANRDLLILDSFREFKNRMMSEVGVPDNEAPKVDLGMTFNFADSRYVRNKNGWLAASLYKKAEEDKLKPFRMPLACVDTSILPFRCGNLDDFIWHMKRCMACDTSIPILLDDYGRIADGNHRVAKAILDGERYVLAYRLTKMPPIDYTDDEENS